MKHLTTSQTAFCASLKVLGPAIIVLFFGSASTCAQSDAVRNDVAAFEIPGSEVRMVRSELLGRRYFAYVKLPRSYADEKNKDRTYPVIYLNDGPYTFQVASGLTHLSMSSGAIEEAIVVGISFAEGENGQASRTRDMTPTRSDEFEGTETGGAADYLRFLKSEFFPHIERAYRIDPKRRTLVGQSFGGLFGIYTLLTEPELFETYILTSSSIWYDNGALFDLEVQYAQAHSRLPAKVFLAVGEFESPVYEGTTNEMVDQQRAFVAALESRNYDGLQLKSEIIAGTGHHTTFPFGLGRGLMWALPGPTPKN